MQSPLGEAKTAQEPPSSRQDGSWKQNGQLCRENGERRGWEVAEMLVLSVQWLGLNYALCPEEGQDFL